VHLALVPTVICDLKDLVVEGVIGGPVRRFIVSRAAKNGHFEEIAKAKAEKNRKRKCDFIFSEDWIFSDY
jgi:hypothetical protein